MFKVLIAEDDADLRQLFQHVLIQNGYYVKGVSNGQEGLDELEKDSYDLIISDIMMPVMDGYTFIRTLREQGKNMPVLTIGQTIDAARTATNLLYLPSIL